MQKNKKNNKKGILVLAIIAIVILLILGKFLFGVLKLSPIVYQYFTNNSIQLKQTNQRVNLLLLGIGGGTHDGPNLTDTIIFSSIDPKTKNITLVSIPRDLWSSDLQAKVNTAYAFGEEKKKGEGISQARSVMEKIVGQKINYVVRIDFDGFVKAVDLLGGLDITVDQTLDDYEYPIEGKEDDPCGHKQEELAALATASSQLEAFPCRYQHIHFDKGLQHMDGKMALEYVRSRHGVGNEGSDFARSKRQEKVIAGAKEKFFSTETLLNPSKVVNLYTVLSQSIDTDIKQDEFDDFIRLAQNMKGAKIHSAVIDTGDEQEKRQGLLVHPLQAGDYSNQWVLIPKSGNGNFSEIQAYIDCEIKVGNCATLPSQTPSQKEKSL